MLNLTILHLLASHLTNSPLISTAQSKARLSFTLLDSHFSFSTVSLYKSESVQQMKCVKNTFSHFLDTVIVFAINEIPSFGSTVNETIIIISDDSRHVLIDSCVFDTCHTNDSGGAINYQQNDTIPALVEIKSSTFFNCTAVKGSAVLFAKTAKDGWTRTAYNITDCCILNSYIIPKNGEYDNPVLMEFFSGYNYLIKMDQIVALHCQNPINPSRYGAQFSLNANFFEVSNINSTKDENPDSSYLFWSQYSQNKSSISYCQFINQKGIYLFSIDHIQGENIIIHHCDIVNFILDTNAGILYTALFNIFYADSIYVSDCNFYNITAYNNAPKLLNIDDTSGKFNKCLTDCVAFSKILQYTNNTDVRNSIQNIDHSLCINPVINIPTQKEGENIRAQADEENTPTQADEGSMPTSIDKNEYQTQTGDNIDEKTPTFNDVTIPDSKEYSQSEHKMPPENPTFLNESLIETDSITIETNDTTPNKTVDSSKKIPAGGIAGIVIAILVVIAVVIAAIILLKMKRPKKSEEVEKEMEEASNQLPPLQSNQDNILSSSNIFSDASPMSADPFEYEVEEDI